MKTFQAKQQKISSYMVNLKKYTWQNAPETWEKKKTNNKIWNKKKDGINQRAPGKEMTEC